MCEYVTTISKVRKLLINTNQTIDKEEFDENMFFIDMINNLLIKNDNENEKLLLQLGNSIKDVENNGIKNEMLYYYKKIFNGKLDNNNYFCSLLELIQNLACSINNLNIVSLTRILIFNIRCYNG